MLAPLIVAVLAIAAGPAKRPRRRARRAGRGVVRRRLDRRAPEHRPRVLRHRHESARVPDRRAARGRDEPAPVHERASREQSRSLGPLALVGLAWGTVVARVTDVGLFRGGLLAYACGELDRGARGVRAGTGPLALLARARAPARPDQLRRVHLPLADLHLDQPCAYRSRAARADRRCECRRRSTLAIVSFVFLEQPIRQGRAVIGRTRWVALPVAASTVAAGALVVGAIAPPLAATFAPAVSQASVLRAARDASVVDHDRGVGRYREIAVGRRGAAAREAHPHRGRLGRAHARARDRALGRAPRHRRAERRRDRVPAPERRGRARLLGCGDAIRRPVPDAFAPGRSTSASSIRISSSSLYGAWDVYDASLDHGKTWVSPGQPAFDRYYASKVADAARRLQATGARVLWLTPPCFAANGGSLDPNAAVVRPGARRGACARSTTRSRPATA